MSEGGRDSGGRCGRAACFSNVLICERALID